MLIKNKAEKARFGAIGIINTGLDFGLFFVLKAFGLPVISANLISTTVAFLFSFIANKKYTFRTQGTNVRREFILFVVVTLFGLWVIQNIVMTLVLSALEHSGFHSTMTVLFAKSIATAASLVWNYSLYSRIVFAEKRS